MTVVSTSREIAVCREPRKGTRLTGREIHICIDDGDSYMSSKNVSLREDVYRELKATKGEDESFSDAIERLLAAERDEHPLYGLVGLLDDEEAERVREGAEKFRESLDEDMRRHT